MIEGGPEDEIAAIRRQLEGLDEERNRLAARLEQLQRAKVDAPRPEHTKPTVTNCTSAVEKVALFRRQFGGRDLRLPCALGQSKVGKVRVRTGVRKRMGAGRVLAKPQVKCGDCPNKAFIPVTSEVIECHLRGEDRVRHLVHNVR